MKHSSGKTKSIWLITLSFVSALLLLTTVTLALFYTIDLDNRDNIIQAGDFSFVVADDIPKVQEQKVAMQLLQPTKIFFPLWDSIDGCDKFFNQVVIPVNVTVTNTCLTKMQVMPIIAGVSVKKTAANGTVFTYSNGAETANRLVKSFIFCAATTNTLNTSTNPNYHQYDKTMRSLLLAAQVAHPELTEPAASKILLQDSVYYSPALIAEQNAIQSSVLQEKVGESGGSVTFMAIFWLDYDGLLSVVKPAGELELARLDIVMTIQITASQYHV